MAISKSTINGTTYTDLTGNLYFKSYYNSSIQKYGVREEIVQPVSEAQEEMQLWTNAYLSALSQSFKHTNIKLSNMRNVITESYINYNDGTGGRLPRLTPSTVYDTNLGVTKTDVGDYKLTCPMVLEDNITLMYIYLNLKKVGTPTGTIRMIINYSSDVDGLQDAGTATTTLDVSTLTTSYTSPVFIFNPNVTLYKNYYVTMTLDCTELRSLTAGNYVVARTAATNIGTIVKDYNSNNLRAIPNQGIYYTTTGRLLVPTASIDNQIESVEYTINENGLETTVTAGQKFPDIFYKLKQIERRLSDSTSL